jgi:membrane protein
MAWDILSDSIKNFQENGDGNLAASIAFYAILSAIPLLILTTLAAGLVFGSEPAIKQELIRVIREFHPYISEELIGQLGKIEEKSRLLGGLGLITLVWTSSLIFNSLQNALGIIFRSSADRNFFVGKLLALSMIPIGWTVAATNAAVTYTGSMLETEPAGGDALSVRIHVMLFRYLLPYLITVSFFTFVYKVIPTARVSLRHALAGSVLFSALMEITKHLFTWYMGRSSQYSIVYGPLETVVVLVVWVYYVSLILLFCAELISSYRKRDLILLEKTLLRNRSKNAH